MDPDSLETYVRSRRWGRLATVSADGEPHVAPVGYVVSDGIWFHALVGSRRGRDISRGSRCSLCIDDGLGDGEGYADRRGAVLYGGCELVAADDPRIPEVRRLFATVFFGDPDRRFERRTHAWYLLRPDRTASWDFSRIPPGTDRHAAASVPPERTSHPVVPAGGPPTAPPGRDADPNSLR
ncbi:hypothetical protein GIS00_25415 [Nakamurella sp. YIM 132087]|uniref:Pyridoxamine 5'-phosphate oxidase N-terminal domain-containing protein n=1 Tax=Nakamurella alba TaxID=2665158 RepID=A0A7K1FSY9_9ACTN|nr:pyridoxamine 5'-phosphate oxidase family protein [Nakamurella alba]MTD17275.1 hypothetical protein [Nakamurella alba]